MKSQFFIFIVLWVFALNAGAQASFTDRNDLLAYRNIHSAVPVAIADMNGDGLDDIVTLNEGTNLLIQYQTPDPQRPFVRFNLELDLANNEQNDICIADFNNDGANDIFTIGSYDRIKILYGIPYSNDFNLVTQFITPFFSQGASTGDFNGDGWVDIVILNDNGLNYTLLNDGSGNLVEDTLFNFVTVPSSDNSGNYGSVYTDFDMDGDNDFYISKCRQGVNSQNDPRRINVLFVNDGNNNYTEDAANYGLASGRQTWTTDIGDIDNDGDLDAFMTQHDVISQLFENIGNDTFINITLSAGLNIGGIPLQGMFRDFDNDGFVDILVSGDRVDYYHNNGDKTFTRINAFGNTIFGTYALGDLNNDGFTDVYASRVIPFNTPDLLREDILYITEKNENHFLSLLLYDPVGNRSAIGAMAILYGAWGIQIRDVRGGEQYGVSNGHQMIFGLGQETSYDSLIIRWPDGSKEYYNSLAIDQKWLIQRGNCFTKSVKVWDELSVACDNDSIILKVETATTPVQWSNGSLSDSIIITETGIYFASFIDDNGCLVRTVPTELITDPDTIMPEIIYNGHLSLCNNETAILSLPSALGYQWSNGENEQAIIVGESGMYYAEVQGFCKTLLSDTIELIFIIPDLPVVENDTFLAGENAILVAEGDSIIWYDDLSGSNIIGQGSELVLNGLTESTTVYAINLGILEGQDYQVGPVQHEGSSKYNAQFVNGGLIFQVLEPIVLREVTMFTDSAGTRTIEITKPGGFIFSQEVNLETGKTTVQLDAELLPGEYTISTNTDRNNAEFGANSPFLWRTSELIIYPIEVENVISIVNSTLGTGFYYYFYDWKISTQDQFCESDLVPVTAVLGFPVGMDDPFGTNELRIYPNPTHGITTISYNPALQINYTLFNSDGRMILNAKTDTAVNAWEVDIASLSPGVYYIRINVEGDLVTKKIIKL